MKNLCFHNFHLVANTIITIFISFLYSKIYSCIRTILSGSDLLMAPIFTRFIFVTYGLPPCFYFYSPSNYQQISHLKSYCQKNIYLTFSNHFSEYKKKLFFCIQSHFSLQIFKYSIFVLEYVIFENFHLYLKKIL